MADVIVINLEKAPEEGSYTLQSVDGVIQWVEVEDEGGSED